MKNLNLQLTIIINLIRSVSAAVFLTILYKILVHYGLIDAGAMGDYGFFHLYGLIFLALLAFSLLSLIIGGTALIAYIFCAIGYIISDLILFMAFRNVPENKYQYRLFNPQFVIYFQR